MSSAAWRRAQAGGRRQATSLDRREDMPANHKHLRARPWVRLLSSQNSLSAEFLTLVWIVLFAMSALGPAKVVPVFEMSTLSAGLLFLALAYALGVLFHR